MIRHNIPIRSLFIIVTTFGSLTGCKHHRDKEAAVFKAACSQAEFSPKQCAFLYAMHRQQEDDADDSMAMSAAGFSAATSANLNAMRR